MNTMKKKCQKTMNSLRIFRYFHVSHCLTKCFALFPSHVERWWWWRWKYNNKSQKAARIPRLPYLYETNFSIIMLLISGKIIRNFHHETKIEAHINIDLTLWNCTHFVHNVHQPPHHHHIRAHENTTYMHQVITELSLECSRYQRLCSHKKQHI